LSYFFFGFEINECCGVLSSTLQKKIWDFLWLHYLFLHEQHYEEFMNLVLAFKKYLVCTIWNCKLNYFGGELKWVSSTYKLVLEPKGAW